VVGRGGENMECLPSRDSVGSLANVDPDRKRGKRRPVGRPRFCLTDGRGGVRARWRIRRISSTGEILLFRAALMRSEILTAIGLELDKLP
jgi:hypothetical protein